mgnify:CR=1 FL=1
MENPCTGSVRKGQSVPVENARSGGGGGQNGAGDAGALHVAIAVRVLGQILLVVVLGEVERAGFRGASKLGRDRAKLLTRERRLIDLARVRSGALLGRSRRVDGRAISSCRERA